MKQCSEILETIRENAARVKDLDAQVRTMPYNKRTEPGIIEAAKQSEILRMENAILRDNARRAYIAETLPGVLDIWNDAAGRALGPKTQEKLNTAAKEKLSCSFYVEQNDYRAELTIVPLNEHGYSGTCWRYDDFCLSTTYTVENRNRLPLLDGNKIVPRTLGDFTMYCAEYVEDVHAAALDILKSWAALREQYAALRDAVRTFNEKLPTGIDQRNVDRWRDYLFID